MMRFPSSDISDTKLHFRKHADKQWHLYITYLDEYISKTACLQFKLVLTSMTL